MKKCNHIVEYISFPEGILVLNFKELSESLKNIKYCAKCGELLKKI